MANLGWGKCKLEAGKLGADGAAPTKYDVLDTPKKDTTKLTTTAGEEITALEEGGGVVDSRSSGNSYQLEWDMFVKKGTKRPFEDVDGVIAGEWAIKLTPEDAGCEGLQIDRAVIRCEESYTTAEGKILHYVAKCLKPKTGKTIKPLVNGSVPA